MTVKCINSKDKNKIVTYYEKGYTHDTLAEWYGTSRRTIARILEQAGVLREHNPYTAEEKRILKLVREFGLSSAKLRSALVRNQAQRPKKAVSHSTVSHA